MNSVPFRYDALILAIQEHLDQTIIQDVSEFEIVKVALETLANENKVVIENQDYLLGRFKLLNYLLKYPHVFCNNEKYSNEIRAIVKEKILAKAKMFGNFTFKEKLSYIEQLKKDKDELNLKLRSIIKPINFSSGRIGRWNSMDYWFSLRAKIWLNLTGDTSVNKGSLFSEINKLYDASQINSCKSSTSSSSSSGSSITEIVKLDPVFTTITSEEDRGIIKFKKIIKFGSEELEFTNEDSEKSIFTIIVNSEKITALHIPGQDSVFGYRIFDYFRIFKLRYDFDHEQLDLINKLLTNTISNPLCLEFNGEWKNFIKFDDFYTNSLRFDDEDKEMALNLDFNFDGTFLITVRSSLLRSIRPELRVFSKYDHSKVTDSEEKIKLIDILKNYRFPQDQIDFLEEILRIGNWKVFCKNKEVKVTVENKKSYNLDVILHKRILDEKNGLPIGIKIHSNKSGRVIIELDLKYPEIKNLSNLLSDNHLIFTENNDVIQLQGRQLKEAFILLNESVQGLIPKEISKFVDDLIEDREWPDKNFEIEEEEEDSNSNDFFGADPAEEVNLDDFVFGSDSDSDDFFT